MNLEQARQTLKDHSSSQIFNIRKGEHLGFDPVAQDIASRLDALSPAEYVNDNFMIKIVDITVPGTGRADPDVRVKFETTAHKVKGVYELSKIKAEWLNPRYENDLAFHTEVINGSLKRRDPEEYDRQATLLASTVGVLEAYTNPRG